MGFLINQVPKDIKLYLYWDLYFINFDRSQIDEYAIKCRH